MTELFKEEELEGLPPEIRKQAEDAAKEQEGLKDKEESDSDGSSDQDAKEEKEEFEAKEPEVQKEPEKPEEPEVKQEDFEHKYKVLQGMIRKKDDDLRLLSSDVDKLKQDLDRANKIIDGFDQKHPETEKEEESKSLNPEEFEDYGDEMKKLVNTLNHALEENKKLKAQMDNPSAVQEVQSKVDNIEQRQVKTEKQRFIEALDSSVPDWETINNDTRFHAFLMEEDPFSGVRRQDLLANAEQNLDIGRVTKFFNIFKKLTEPAKEVEPKPKKDSLESEIVPDKSGDAPVSKVVKTVSSTQLDKASRDFGRGLISEDEYNKVEKQYIKQLGG